MPDWQTWPTAALPFGMPLTDHVTVVSVAFVTVGVNDARKPVERVALGGETLTPMLLVTVTFAEAVCGRVRPILPRTSTPTNPNESSPPS